MKARFFIFSICIAFFVNMGHAYISADINNAVNIYTTNKALAVSNLLKIYESNNAYLDFIGTYLFDEQSYRLYRDFLRAIPPSSETVSDLVVMDLLTLQTTYLIHDLEAYLDEFLTPDAVLISYSDQVLDETIVGYLTNYLTNRSVFTLLSEAYKLQAQTKVFDKILIRSAPNQNLSNQTISNYVIKSWYTVQRDLTALLDTFELTNGVMNGIRLQSLYLSGRYDDVVDEYTAHPVLFDEEQLIKIQIDLNYVLSDSYFQLGDHTNSQYYLDQVKFPWSYDVGEMTFLNRIAMEQYESAEYQLNFIKDEEKQLFFSMLLSLLTGYTDDTIYEIQSYILDVESDHEFLPEALLLYHAYFLNPDLFEDTLSMIVDSLLNEDSSPLESFPLTYAYLKSGEESDSGSEAVDDYLLYQQALKLMEDGQSAEAQEILTELIVTEGTSPLIKSLAVYKLRDLS